MEEGIYRKGVLVTSKKDADKARSELEAEAEESAGTAGDGVDGSGPGASEKATGSQESGTDSGISAGGTAEDDRKGAAGTGAPAGETSRRRRDRQMKQDSKEVRI